jgi:hypothetical protein
MLERAIHVGERTWWDKATSLLLLQHVDRMTPAAERYLKGIQDRDTAVYVNGELAGAAVGAAKSLGFRTIFLPHNFAAEYHETSSNSCNPIRAAYVRVAARNAVAGCQHADLCLFLTQNDEQGYRSALGENGATMRAMSGMYFACREDVPQPNRRREPSNFTILLNTNLGAPANEEGALNFLREIWPNPARSDGWKLILAGGFPSQAIHDAAHAAGGCVQVVCSPDPAEMEEIFAASSVCVATTLRGSGIKLRIGESLKRGLPVVSTEHCARGYESISPQVLRIFQTADEAVLHLKNLATDIDPQLSDMCRQEFQRHHGFEAGLAKMKRIAEYFD